MKCLICGDANWEIKFQYALPDKYEKWQKIDKPLRSWMKCVRCGFYVQTRNYPLSQLEGIYKKGYRHPKFRGETIAEAHDRIITLNYDQSENRHRAGWFGMQHPVRRMLDYGSGLGVYPKYLADWDVESVCIEENEYSIKFITEELGIDCYKSINEVIDAGLTFDKVAMIHILEHIEDPVEFLQPVKSVLEPNGIIAVEVPDSSEFEFLDKNNDEFNSCHVYFYDVPSLYKILDRAGYRVENIHREYYRTRGLMRLMATAKMK